MIQWGRIEMQCRLQAKEKGKMNQPVVRNGEGVLWGRQERARTDGELHVRDVRCDEAATLNMPCPPKTSPKRHSIKFRRKCLRVRTEV